MSNLTVKKRILKCSRHRLDSCRKSSNPLKNLFAKIPIKSRWLYPKNLMNWKYFRPRAVIRISMKRESLEEIKEPKKVAQIFTHWHRITRLTLRSTNHLRVLFCNNREVRRLSGHFFRNRVDLQMSHFKLIPKLALIIRGRRMKMSTNMMMMMRINKSKRKYNKRTIQFRISKTLY